MLNKRKMKTTKCAIIRNSLLIFKGNDFTIKFIPTCNFLLRATLPPIKVRLTKHQRDSSSDHENVAPATLKNTERVTIENTIRSIKKDNTTPIFSAALLTDSRHFINFLFI